MGRAAEMREISVDLPALGNPTSPTSASSFSSSRSFFSSPGHAGFVLGRRLVSGGGEVLIAASAAAAFGDDEAVARRGEIVQQLAGLGVVDDRADRDWQLDRLASRPVRWLPSPWRPRSALCSGLKRKCSRVL